MIIVRELTGGLYYGTPRGISGDGPEERGTNTMTYTRAKSTASRAWRLNWPASGGRNSPRWINPTCSKLRSSGATWWWKSRRITATSRSITCSSITAAMQLVLNPKRFDVLVTENMFGDILERRRRGAGRFDRHAALGFHRREEAFGRMDRALRAGAWFGARYRGAEQSQSVRRHRIGRGDARIQLRTHRRSGGGQSRDGSRCSTAAGSRPTCTPPARRPPRNKQEKQFVRQFKNLSVRKSGIRTSSTRSRARPPDLHRSAPGA